MIEKKINRLKNLILKIKNEINSEKIWEIDIEILKIIDKKILKILNIKKDEE